MLRSTHKIIAEKIAEYLGFSAHNSYIFVDGTLGPDTHGDFPHKTGKNRKILQKIDEARQLFFLNDEYAYGELGNALHYIQDKWVDDVKIGNETNLTTDDNAFTEEIEQAQIPENLKQEYLNIANILLRIKNNGIDSWFNHQWGIWHIDYASCVYVFADIVEMMLPTLQPDPVVTSDKAKLKQYVQSEAFKHATKEGFLASLIINYLDPKIQGYTAAMFTLSLIEPPTNQSNSEINLHIVYRLSQEIARYTLAKPEQFRCQDNWTHKTNTQQVKLGLLKPQYLTLIPRPVNEVHKERLSSFFAEKQIFLGAWPSIQKAMQTIQRTETWKIILSGLIEILKTEGNKL
jgi:hypothetical protein